MNRLLLKLAMLVTVGSLLYSIPAATQVSPTTRKAVHVRITQGPEIERADPDFAIIRWTSNNPGGSPEHAVRLFAEDGTEYGTPIYFSGFDELAQVPQREAGVTCESLEDRFIRYDSGEEVQIHMSLEDDQIAYFGFSPHLEAA